MIYYLVSQAHAYTMSSFLAFRGKHLARHIRILAYEDLFWEKYLNRGAYIFSDLERLTPARVMSATTLHDALCRHSRRVSILNHPISSLTRYALLRKLYNAGINPFNVYRADEGRSPERFPVFLRRENDHEGSITPLLHDNAELSNALDAVQTSGTRLSDILIVEYWDIRNHADAYVKYGVFKLGDHFIADHVFTGYHWIVKEEQRMDGTEEAELAFLKQNPHVQMISPIFQLAGIDYGRVDYSMRNGNPVIWEINTNPMMTSLAFRGKVDQYYSEQLSKALDANDLSADSGKRIANPVYAGWTRRGKNVIKHVIKHSPMPIRQKIWLRGIYKHLF